MIIADDYFKKGKYYSANDYYVALGNAQKVKECQVKLLSSVKPGEWEGPHVNFSVTEDGKSISNLDILYPTTGGKYTAIKVSGIEIDNNKTFSWTDYLDHLQLNGQFLSKTKAKIIIYGVLVEGKTGQDEIIAEWKNN